MTRLRVDVYTKEVTDDMATMGMKPLRMERIPDFFPIWLEKIVFPIRYRRWLSDFRNMLNSGLALFAWITREIKAGRKIILIDEKTKTFEYASPPGIKQ